MPDDEQDDLSDEEVLRQSMEQGRASRPTAPAGLSGGSLRVPPSGITASPVSYEEPFIPGVVGGDGIFAQTPQTPGGVANGKSYEPIPLPFEVVAPTTPSTGEVRVKINKFSYLLQSLEVDDGITVDGLDTDFTIAVGNRIWLELDIDNYTITGASISADGIAGDSWDVFPEPGTWDGTGTYADPYDLQKVYLAIACCVAPTAPRPGKIFSAGSTQVKVVQQLFTNLMATDARYQGKEFIALVPSIAYDALS